MPVPKKMRPAEDKYGGDSDHQSDGEGGVQPMMTKIKTVLKSEWCLCSVCLRVGQRRATPCFHMHMEQNMIHSVIRVTSSFIDVNEVA